MKEDVLELELFNRQQAWELIRTQLFPFLAEVMQGGGRWVLSVTRRKRTKPQNRRYWGKGVLAQVAAQATSNGRLYDAETWHEFFKRKFIGVVELPGGSVVGMTSTTLDTVQFSAFCDQVEAYAATELGVTFYDLEPRLQPVQQKAAAKARNREVIDADTGEILEAA